MGLKPPKGVAPFSQNIYDLHMIVLVIVTVIGIGVLAQCSMLCMLLENLKVPKQAMRITWLAIWTVIPLFILVGIAVPATEALIKMEDVSGSEMTVKVTGYQWMAV